MAITTNLPPQAYTRDTLVKAIEWMGTQPPAVRERANSADLIVSFYLQARRRMTAAQLEAPVSGENFKQDLKHLALDLKQFEDPSAAPPTPSRALSHGSFESSEPEEMHPPNSGSIHNGQSHGHSHSPGSMRGPQAGPAPGHGGHHNHLHTAPSPQATSHSHAQQHVHLHVQSPPPVMHHPPPVAPPVAQAPLVKGTTWHVDQRSMNCARELQQRLNLGTEAEALRMLITLGMERAREMFPG